MCPLPAEAVVDVPNTLSHELFRATRQLPDFDPRDFYDDRVQSAALEHIRASCRDGADWLFEQIKRRLRRAPFCALLKGLEFDPGHRLFVALNRAFGTLVARPHDPATPRARLIHHIQPSTDKAARSGKYSEQLHTDGAERPEPMAYLAMQCVRADPGGGGWSRLLDVTSFRSVVEQQMGAERLRFLETEKLPWQIGDYLGGGITWATVLHGERLRWRRYTVERALAGENVSLAPPAQAILDDLEHALAATDRTLSFFLQPGDFLFMDNRRCLHARTPVSDLHCGRLMLRAWIDGEADTTARQQPA